MFSELMARAKVHFDNGLPFVLYRKPKEPIINGLFQGNSALHYIKDFTEVGFVFAPFDSQKHGVLIRCDEQLQVSDFKSISVFNGDTVSVTNDIEKEELHIKLVEKGLAEIAKNALEKVVLSRQLTVDTKKNPFDLFITLLSSYVNAFCYLWFHPKVGLWLGATPEILLMTENNRFTTMSLAGTRVYADDQDRPWGKKELSEQVLVTKYIEKVLQNIALKLNISEVEAFRAGNLQHLRTKITGDFKGNLKEIVKALHPTPAVCGMPLEPARKFILEHENYNREFYTGFLGELNLKSTRHRTVSRKNQEHEVYKSIKTKSTLWVNLRCMQMVSNAAIIYIGGGITKDSVPEMEWQETEEKSKTMLHILQQS